MEKGMVNTMKLSIKQLPVLVGFILILGFSNVVFALLYMSRDVDITGGVSVVGSIEVYEIDGVTVMTSYDFLNFTGGVEEISYKEFFINNTGNQPVYVHWNISSSSLTWQLMAEGYMYVENLVDKYLLMIEANWTTISDFWGPINGGLPPLHIPVGEGKHLRFYLWYSGTPNTAEAFSLTVTFYAEDA
jgi:hypothetical protein